MKKILLSVFLAITALAIFYFVQDYRKINGKTVNDVLAQVQEKRAIDISSSTANEADTSIFGDKNTINVLLLGADSRYNVTSTRCDAIHMLSFDVKNWKITITSVPRGTYTYLKGYPQSQSYMANACAVLGIDGTKKRIENLIGTKADYTLTIGYGQLYGILRELGAPTTQSVEWLRNRKTFLIGDPQRSHNQAVFIKDLITKEIDKFGSDLTLPVEQVVFSFTNSDIDFASAHALLVGFKNAGISAHPENIQLAMKPYYKTIDYHFDFTNPTSSLKSVGIRGAGSSNPSDTRITLKTEQQQIISYIKNILNRKQPLGLRDIVKKQLWLQIEDENTRENLEYSAVKMYAAQFKTTDEKIKFVSDYIMEKQAFGQDAWAQKGQDLMEQVAKT